MTVAAAIVVFALNGCDSISNKSVFEELNAAELSKAIKKDSLFGDVYKGLQETVTNFNDLEKAEYRDVTYRRFFKFVKTLNAMDTTLGEKWKKEWENIYGAYLPKADSVLDYWKKYSEDNSLQKYVKIELAEINKEYYSYSRFNDIRDVKLGFRLSPLQGPMDQVRFIYGYMTKISGLDSKYYKKHRCLATGISKPKVGYFDVDYSDRKNFSGETVESFLKNYNLNIEIERILKDGIIIEDGSLNVPTVVSEYWQTKADGFTVLLEMKKTDLIKELINKDYKTKDEYTMPRMKEMAKKTDERCFNFAKKADENMMKK
jgi:hypothetical protein